MAADADPAEFTGPLTGSTGAASAPAEEFAPGSRIGEFEIVDLLGEGGMGQVYRARQEHPARDVALKLIRGRALGRDAVRRFEFEAQVLGRLQHPGVAQIYHAGLHGDDPYFAMELVEGEPLHEYAAREQLDARARLELIVKVCSAVQHAHAKGVVHRDLKPANILVTRDGQPKVLDFGVARATDGDVAASTLRTEIGQLVGTIPYMSPEQASGDPDAIDTRSDVYALGVITYELLTGRFPYDIAAKLVHEAVRIIREVDARPLSSVHAALRGDVEVIVAKSLEKDKDRRYQSAHELAEDIHRFLTNQPIVARPPSAAYQLRKFALRNRALVGGAVAVLLALLLGLVGTLWQAARAAERARSAELAEAAARESERRALTAAERANVAESDARRQAETASRVADFLTGMLQSAGPQVALGRDTTLLRDIIGRARTLLDAEPIDDPSVRSRLLRVLGIVYHDLAEYDLAEDLTRRALAAARETGEGESRAIARAMFDLARVHETLGRYAEALEGFRGARDMFVRLEQGDAPDALSALSGIGGVLLHERKFDDAVVILRDVLERRRRTLGDRPSEAIADAISRLSTALSKIDPVEALALGREALAMRRTLYGELHPNLALSLVNLGVQISASGDATSAIRYLDEGLAQHRSIYGSKHPYTAAALNAAAAAHEQLGQLDAALAERQETLAILREVHGQNERPTLDAVWRLGQLHERMGSHIAAEQQYRVMLDYAETTYPPGDNRTSGVLLIFAKSLSLQGRDRDAELVYRRAYDALCVGRPSGHAQLASARDALIACLLTQRDYPAAEPLLLASHAERATASAADGSNAAALRLAEFYASWATLEPSPEAAAARHARASEWRARATEHGRR